MADTAKRLFGPASLTNSAATKYTVPGATTAIIKHIIVANTNSFAETFTLSIGADAVGTRLFPGVTIPANSIAEWTGFVPMAAGEIIQAFDQGGGNHLTLTISGVEVT